MAVTHVGTGAAFDSTSAVSPGFPAGVIAGDLLVLCVFTFNQGNSIPSGWHQVTMPTGQGVAGANGSAKLQVFTRVATGSDSCSLSDSGAAQAGAMLAFRGVDTTVGVDGVRTASGNNTAGTTISSAAWNGLASLGDYVIAAFVVGAAQTSMSMSFSGSNCSNSNSIGKIASDTVFGSGAIGAGWGGPVINTSFSAGAITTGKTPNTSANNTIGYFAVAQSPLQLTGNAAMRPMGFSGSLTLPNYATLSAAMAHMTFAGSAQFLQINVTEAAAMRPMAFAGSAQLIENVTLNAAMQPMAFTGSLTEPSIDITLSASMSAMSFDGSVDIFAIDATGNAAMAAMGFAGEISMIIEVTLDAAMAAMGFAGDVEIINNLAENDLTGTFGMAAFSFSGEASPVIGATLVGNMQPMGFAGIADYSFIAFPTDPDYYVVLENASRVAIVDGLNRQATVDGLDRMADVSALNRQA